MSTIDQSCELDPVGTADISQRIKRRPDRSTRVEDVINEDHGLATDRTRDVRRSQLRLRALVQVIPVQPDVQAPCRNRSTFDSLECECEALGQRHPPRLNPEKDDVLKTSVLLQDLVGDSPNSPIHVAAVHHLRHASHPRT